MKRFSTVVIEAISPCLDGGKYPVKRVLGEKTSVSADVFKDGHDQIQVILKTRKAGTRKWKEFPMHASDNDRWHGEMVLEYVGFQEYTIEAWTDVFATWRHEFFQKFQAGVQDLWSEMLEGAAMVETAGERARGSGDCVPLLSVAEQIRKVSPEAVFEMLQGEQGAEIQDRMARWADRSSATEYRPFLTIRVDRKEAEFAAWYEFFPRSAEGHGDRGSKFRDCVGRVEDAKAMGFDVIYFPPIHPIGVTKRKGKNNSLTSEPGDPGVPYAIGSEFGGHKDVEPELGTMKDFEWLVKEIRKRGMEVALDFAINCSPDHPYVKEYPDWFFHRPDGTIKYAENPPKKYEDVYPLNFHNPDWQNLWEEMVDIILFWCRKNVRIFRVDNPHTKPVAFWEYLIGKVQKKFPDVIFLSEAFTRPKMMRVLAKVGFTQSYTYFTWRTQRWELIEYFEELTQSGMQEYFRPNLWPNTPDILPYGLQRAGRNAFLSRYLLAATLSGTYGIYSGFELCENEPVEGKEEYLNSEKYQFKARDWNAPGNIKAEIARINRVRSENGAFQTFKNLQFHHADNDQMLNYSKVGEQEEGLNRIYVIVNLEPEQLQSGMVEVPLERFDLQEDQEYWVHDLLTDERFLWKGRRNYVELNPAMRVAHVFRIEEKM